MSNIKINELAAVDSIADGDLFPLWSTSNGDTRRTSFSVMTDAITDAVQADILPDGDKGDIIVSGSGAVWTIGSGTITSAALTVLDDTTVGGMVDTLGGAASTGTGGIARATSPTFVTPILGTPTSGNLANCTGYPIPEAVASVARFIEGAYISVTANDAISVSAGQCSLESGGDTLAWTTALTATSLSLSASTWYHVYAYDTGGGAAGLEVVTTAPASPYQGTARSKTGNTGHRYIGSVKTDSGALLYRMLHYNGNIVRWIVDDTAADFLMVNNGTVTSFTDINMSGNIPVSAIAAQVRTANSDTSASIHLSNSDLGIVLHRQTPQGGAGFSDPVLIPCDATQKISYTKSAAGSGGGAFIYASGYVFVR
jgi:hypothetical protein